MLAIPQPSPNLAIVDHLWLLEAIYQVVIIPTMVASELAGARNLKISAILQLGWVQTQAIKNEYLAKQLQKERGLDAGEAHAIALAVELQADDLLIDERLGRQSACVNPFSRILKRIKQRTKLAARELNHVG